MGLFSFNESIWERFGSKYFISSLPLNYRFTILEQNFYSLNPQTDDILNFLQHFTIEKRRKAYNTSYHMERQDKVLKKY